MSERGAVLQFEIDRKRWLGSAPVFASRYTGETPEDRLMYLIRTAASDTLLNGGTLVIIATSETVTLVQRPDAEPLE